MKRYINWILIFIGLIILVILISNLYFNNQKSLNSQKYCLDYYKNIKFWLNQTIIECNKH